MNAIAQILAVLLVGIPAADLLAQPEDPVRVAIPDHLSFVLPETFELDGDVEGARTEGALVLPAETKSLMLVPTGTALKERTAGDLPNATFLVVADVGEPGAYAKLGASVISSQEEMDELDANLQSGFIGEATSRGDMSDIEWSGTQVVQLAGTQAIRFRFTGLGPTGDRAIVNVYMIQNNDTMYYLTLSTIEDTAEEWVPSYNAVLSSLVFEPR